MRWIIPFMALSFVNMVAFSMMIPVIPVFIRELGYPDYMVGMVIGSYFLSLFIGSWLMGRLADKLGKRKMLISSYIGSIIGWVSMALAWVIRPYALPLLFLSRIIDGLTGGNNSILQAAVAEKAKDRTKAFGLIGSTFGISFLVGPPLGGLLYSYSGLLGVSATAISISIIAMAIAHLSVPDTPARIPEIRISKIMRPLVLRFSSSAFFSAFTTLVPLFLIDRLNYSSREIGLVFIAIGLIAAANQGLVVPAIEKVLGRKKSLVAGSLLMGLGMVMTYFSSGILQFLASHYIFTLGGLMFVPIIKSILSESGPPGQVMGADESARALARAISPVVATYLYHILSFNSFLAIGISAAIVLSILSFLVI